MKKKIIVILFLFTLAAPMFALAATSIPCVKGNNETVTASDRPRCINQVYIWSLGVAALLAFLMMIVGGYTYMTAQGNAEKSSKGSGLIMSSVIGLALLFGAYLLLSTINPDLVNFSQFNNDFNGLNTPAQSTPPRP